MIISFDLDNTLIPFNDEFEIENFNYFSNLIGVEKIRKGTISLFQILEKDGHQIWIYTTSNRSIFKLKKTFKFYGLNPKRYINEKINRKKLNANNCFSSKNPNLFGIDIHVDDSEGVRMEGKKFKFKTIIIDPNDKNWTKKILQKINQISK